MVTAMILLLLASGAAPAPCDPPCLAGDGSGAATASRAGYRPIVGRMAQSNPGTPGVERPRDAGGAGQEAPQRHGEQETQPARSGPASKPFVPSEKIPADSPVSFPVDI
jgi:hypothetical protein